jgi:hypothetical protein
MQVAERTGHNASHFGVQVASSEDVAAAWTRFKQAGLVTKTETNTECCYALQDKVWVEDPDGNAWEVFVVKGEAAAMGQGPELAEGAKGACCAPSVGNRPEESATPAATSAAASAGTGGKKACCG